MSHYRSERNKHLMPGTHPGYMGWPNVNLVLLVSLQISINTYNYLSTNKRKCRCSSLLSIARLPNKLETID